MIKLATFKDGGDYLITEPCETAMPADKIQNAIDIIKREMRIGGQIEPTSGRSLFKFRLTVPKNYHLPNFLKLIDNTLYVTDIWYANKLSVALREISPLLDPSSKRCKGVLRMEV